MDIFKHIKQKVEKGSDNPLDYYMIAQMYYQLNNFENAIKYAKHMLKIKHLFSNYANKDAMTHAVNQIKACIKASKDCLAQIQESEE